MFTGRLLKCAKCGFTFKSSSSINSMWTTVEIDGKLIDFCPNCWGVPRQHWPSAVKIAYDAYIAANGHPDTKGDNHEQ